MPKFGPLLANPANDSYEALRPMSGLSRRAFFAAATGMAGGRLRGEPCHPRGRSPVRSARAAGHYVDPCGRRGDGGFVRRPQPERLTRPPRQSGRRGVLPQRGVRALAVGLPVEHRESSGVCESPPLGDFGDRRGGTRRRDQFLMGVTEPDTTHVLGRRRVELPAEEVLDRRGVRCTAAATSLMPMSSAVLR